MLPVKLELENFMSYDKADLDFDFNSALIVGETNGNERVSNGSGKSSVFNAVEWALFGESRSKTSDNVVRRGQAMCRVAFVFTHDGRTYRIVRTRNVKNSKMEVQFEEIRENGVVVDLTHDTNKLTDAEIHRVIKATHDVFINSSYFRQNSFFDFVQGTFSSRQSIISSMLNLDKWGDYQKEAKDTLKDLEDKIGKRKNEVEHLAAKTARLKVVEAQTKLSEEQLSALHLDENKLLEEIKALEAKLAENKDAAAEYYKYQELQQRIASQKQSVASVELGIKNKEALADKLKAEAEANSKAIEALTLEIDSVKERLLSIPKTDTAPYESAILDGRSQHKTLTQQIDNLLHNNNCLMCGHEWHDDIAKKKFIDERQAKKTKLEEQLKRAEPKLAAIKAELAAARQFEISLEKQSLQKDKISSTIEFSELRHKATLEEINASKTNLETQNRQLNDLQEMLKSIQAAEKAVDLAEVEASFNQKRDHHKSIRKKLTETSYNLGALAQEAKTLAESIANLKVMEQELNYLTRQAVIYGQLAKAFSKDGIQAIIIDNIVEELTQVANYWLGQLWTEPVYINFITQKKNTKGDWRETFELEFHTPTGVSQFEDFSGGEQFRISFAIRLALSVIQAKRMGGEVQMLMLDEVSTSLDPAGLEVFVSIIKRLEKEMKVMVITHDDKLKEEFETIITVKKTADGSTLV